MRSFLLVISMVLGACGGGKVNSDDAAAMAYRGLDSAVDRGMKLGLQGFNQATSANIDPQSEAGDLAGTMTITGQADQGASANKGLRLAMLLVGYEDIGDADTDTNSEVLITYDTDPNALPALDLQLKNIPNGTVDGTLVGDFALSGDLTGTVTLDLAISGTIVEDSANPGYVRRQALSTTVTGTATNDSGGVYDVNVTL